MDGERFNQLSLLDDEEAQRHLARDCMRRGDMAGWLEICQRLGDFEVVLGVCEEMLRRDVYTEDVKRAVRWLRSEPVARGSYLRRRMVALNGNAATMQAIHAARWL